MKIEKKKCVDIMLLHVYFDILHIVEINMIY